MCFDRYGDVTPGGCTDGDNVFGVRLLMFYVSRSARLKALSTRNDGVLTGQPKCTFESSHYLSQKKAESKEQNPDT